MKKILYLSVAMYMAICVLSIASTNAVQCVDLLAGNPKNVIEDVGDVCVWNDADTLYVQYIIDEGVLLTETHLEIKSTCAEIPQANGNPIPGKFTYSDAVMDPSGQTYAIPLSELGVVAGDSVCIAAHGVVSILECVDCDLCGFEAVLPESAGLFVDWPGLNGSYFDVIVVGGGVLDDLFTGRGWCADPYTNIPDVIPPDDQPLVAELYVDCGDLSGVPGITYDSNMPKVNWIVNQTFDGAQVGDIQIAIWYLLQGGPIGNATPGIPNSVWGYDDTLAKAQEIVDAAEAAEAADGPFSPGCGDIALVIATPVLYYYNNSDELLPEPVPVQTVLIESSMICARGETAWAEGDPFPGKNWAMHFGYTVAETAP